MSRVFLYLPGNFWHSNVTAAKRREYIENFEEWLDALAQAGVPITVSYQQIDLKMVDLSADDFTKRGISLLYAPFNHGLPSLLSVIGLNEYAHWLLCNGAEGNVNGEFYPEFDIPNPKIMRPAQMRIAFALPDPDMIHYSECQDDFKAAESLRRCEALHYGDRVVVPMTGAEAATKAFFTWQRLWTDEALKQMIGELKKITEAADERIAVFFIDLEAVLVGSRHGLEVWKRFFAAIAEAGLQDKFISFDQAAEHWRAKAEKPDVPAAKIVSRNLGGKWTGLQPQLRFLAQDLRVHNPETRVDELVLALATTSDVLSAWDRKLRGDIVLPADVGNVTIGYDQTIIEVALCALRWYKCRRKSVNELIENMSKLPLDADGLWFAERIARELIEE